MYSKLVIKVGKRIQSSKVQRNRTVADADARAVTCMTGSNIPDWGHFGASRVPAGIDVGLGVRDYRSNLVVGNCPDLNMASSRDRIRVYGPSRWYKHTITGSNGQAAHIVSPIRRSECGDKCRHLTGRAVGKSGFVPLVTTWERGHVVHWSGQRFGGRRCGRNVCY